VCCCVLTCEIVLSVRIKGYNFTFDSLVVWSFKFGCAGKCYSEELSVTSVFTARDDY